MNNIINIKIYPLEFVQTAIATSGSSSSSMPLQGQMPNQVPSTPPSSEAGAQKAKCCWGSLDQNIDQLNDVPASSGVNLREEDERLFYVPNQDGHAAEAMGRVAKSGIENASSDIERCLSMCVEEHLRNMVSNLIRLSKQRVDLEKASHNLNFTSDIRHEILLMNKKAKEDWEKKQAEKAEKLQKHNENFSCKRCFDRPPMFPPVESNVCSLVTCMQNSEPPHSSRDKFLQDKPYTVDFHREHFPSPCMPLVPCHSS
eukprot:Gb_41427 [translate_table: standard]